MHHLANALIGAALLSAAGEPQTSPLGSGWLLAIIFGIPTSALGYMAYRAQRGRDRVTDELRDENRSKEQEAERRATDAAQLAAQNEHLQIIQGAQAQAMRSLQEQLSARDEAISARDIEVTRMHALEVAWHEERIELRAQMRRVEDERDRYRRISVALREQLVALGHQPQLDEGTF